MIVGFFPQLLLSLWKHECKRVIADRFTKPEDVEWFDQTLATLVGEEMVDEHKGMVDLGADRYFVDFLRDAPEATGARPTNVQAERDRRHHVSVYHGLFSFLTGEEPEQSDLDSPKVYEPMESFESLKERLNTFLSHYNESIRGTGMDMVFFQDAIVHLIKVMMFERTSVN